MTNRYGLRTRCVLAGSVREVAADLLCDDLRRFSRSRDHMDGPGPEAVESSPSFLNRANDGWVEETRFPRSVAGHLDACPSQDLYETLHAEDGATVVVVLNDGNRSQRWSLVADIGRGWTVYPGTRSSSPAAQVVLPADTFWRLASGSVARPDGRIFVRQVWSDFGAICLRAKIRTWRQ